MSMVEIVALGILVLCAAILCVVGLVNHLEDREIPMPPAKPEHKPRHADWGDTTRLRPPD